MQVITDLTNVSEVTNTVAAIGNYDGVHLGHQQILTNLRQTYPNHSLTVITFEPSPREFFAPATAPPRLSRLTDKLTRLAACEVDQTVVLAFNDELAAMSAEKFVQDVLIDGLHIHALSVGQDYRYGENRSGDIHSLAEYEFELLVQENVQALVGTSDSRISSTIIRACLLQGDCATAADLLGEPYWLTGTVVEGQKIGRTIGFPTLNLDLQGQRPPLSGVYAVTVTLAENSDHQYQGIANYGKRPSVDNGPPSLEVHLFDFASDVYGQDCRVNFAAKIRDEQRFANLAALQQQIQQDIVAAKSLLAEHST